MWQKILIIILGFYFLSLLQNSFLPHFCIFGALPNLVFIFFFLLVFFLSTANHTHIGYKIIGTAVIAGFFLDIFSYTYIGPSIALLIIMGFLLKKAQLILKNRTDNYPFIYFLPLFVIFFSAYNLLLGLYLYFSNSNTFIVNFNAEVIFNLVYNSAVASLFFYAYKSLIFKVMGSREN